MPIRTSLDGFLDNRLQILQPLRGWRAGLDSVLLAAAVPAKPHMMCCEFGTGVGVAALCLAWRTGANIWAVEKHAAYVQLAQQNAHANRLTSKLQIIQADITTNDFLVSFGKRRFAHIFFNPPYYQHSDSRAAPSQGRQMAQSGKKDDLALWLRLAANLLCSGGYVTLVHRADRLDKLLLVLRHAFAGIRVKPIQPYPRRPAHRIVLRAQLGSHAPMRLLSPLILADSPNEPNRMLDRVLRDGQELALSS